MIPVVAFSPSADREEIRGWYLAGASTYVSRPAEHAQLVSVVQAIGTSWRSLNSLPG
ncbi:MAG: hypothetical protein ABJF23_11035 [Bryobacteraceae bacterium]